MHPYFGRVANRTLVLIGILSLAPLGCAIPGSGLGRYRLEGEIVDKASGKPLPGRKVTVTLPEGHGLSALEMATPELFGAKAMRTDLETDKDGRFVREYESVHHGSFFLLPPLGWRPKRAPQPGYAVTITGDCRKTW